MTARAHSFITWMDDVADRLGRCAALVECAVVAGGVRDDADHRKLDLVSIRLRGLTAVVRTLAGPEGPIDWLPALSEQLRWLESELADCVMFRACEDRIALEDLAAVAGDLAGIAAEADLLAAPLRTASGAS